MTFRSIAWKLIALLVLAAILPLTLFGIVSVWQARRTARDAVVTGNMRVAARAADQIHQYIENSLAILRSTAENVSRADLKLWQRERVVRNMALGFEEFSEIILIDAAGAILSTSGVGASRVMASPRSAAVIKDALAGKESYSPVFITDEFVPAMIIALPILSLGDVTGVAAAEVDLIDMWRLADRIRIGKEGYLSVIEPGGRVIASGEGEMKRRALQEQDYPDWRVIAQIAAAADVPSISGRREGRRELLIAAAKLPAPFHWVVALEQPESEAFALARRLTRILAGLVVLFVGAMALVGFLGAQWQIIGPVRELIGGTRRIAAGDLEHRVRVASRDELGQLASSFNQMAGDLALMQKNIRKHERLAFFGRIASGLAHDLKHPIRSIENASALLEKRYDDPEYRETFRRIVGREFAKVNAFLENLHTLSHDIPYHPVEFSLNALLDEVVDTFTMEAQRQGVAIEKAYDAGEARIYADKFSMTRALSNLVNNAMQAMTAGGRLRIGTEVTDTEAGLIGVAIADTGCGIPPERRESIFSDFVTTKRRGLGLGLAIVKRIFDQHGAEVRVESEVGKGTTFVITMPIRTRETHDR